MAGEVTNGCVRIGSVTSGKAPQASRDEVSHGPARQEVQGYAAKDPLGSAGKSGHAKATQALTGVDRHHTKGHEPNNRASPVSPLFNN